MSVLGKIDQCGEVFGIRKNAQTEETYEMEYNLPMILVVAYLHFSALQGLYVVFTAAKIATALFAIFLINFAILGVTAGAHRLWAHRSYEAKWPLRILLLIMHTTAHQNSVLHWSRAHRAHHKHRNTHADPYNPQRGLFFAHVGWLLCRKHPDVIEKGAKIDVSDLRNDPLIKFQHEHRAILMFLFSFALPITIPWWFWNETLTNAFLVAAALRWTCTFNVTSLIQLAAHIDNANPTTSGEDWHNYHHAFPWDYKTSELGRYWCNNTLDFINFFAWIGWAYDLKTVSPEAVKRRVPRAGDGSHRVWGWNDRDLTKEDREAAVILATTG